MDDTLESRQESGSTTPTTATRSRFGLPEDLAHRVYGEWQSHWTRVAEVLDHHSFNMTTFQQARFPQEILRKLEKFARRITFEPVQFRWEARRDISLSPAIVYSVHPRTRTRVQYSLIDTYYFRRCSFRQFKQLVEHSLRGAGFDREQVDAMLKVDGHKWNERPPHPTKRDVFVQRFMGTRFIRTGEIVRRPEALNYARADALLDPFLEGVWIDESVTPDSSD